MNNRKGNMVIYLVILLLLVSGCAANPGIELQEDGTSLKEPVEEAGYAQADIAAATGIYLDENEIIIDGEGATAENNLVTISGDGTYAISGKLTNGQIVIDAGKEDTVRLVLDGVELTNPNGAAIYSKKAKTTILSLAEGSVNTFADGISYTYGDAEKEEPDAAVFSKGDLIITGTGTLQVTASFNNGIGCKDHLCIESGTILVSAANHGIRGRDSVTITNGSFTIESGNDGIQSNNSSGADVGWIFIEGGIFEIVSAHDGIQAETALTIAGGEFQIQTGGGYLAGGDPQEGSKGLKAGTDLEITGGQFEINSLDDTVHSNGTVTISGGSLLLYSGDDGIHADDTVAISGGLIEIATSYEGIEGSVIKIAGGEIRLHATDDGVNIAGGSDRSGQQHARPGQLSASDDRYLEITGGRLVVTADGDGLDSNGNIFMSAGTVLVNGPTKNGDAPIDFDGRFDLSGGILVAAGSSGMAQTPGSESEQPTLMLYFSATQPAGTAVHVSDENGVPLLTYLPEKEYQCILISSPDFSAGITYSVHTGGASLGEVQDGLSLQSAFSDARHLLNVTLSDGVTAVDEAGNPATGRAGGAGGPGMGGRGAPGGPR